MHAEKFFDGTVLYVDIFCCRYPTLNMQYFKPWQVKHQYDGVDSKYLNEIVQISEKKSKKYGEC